MALELYTGVFVMTKFIFLSFIKSKCIFICIEAISGVCTHFPLCCFPLLARLPNSCLSKTLCYVELMFHWSVGS